MSTSCRPWLPSGAFTDARLRRILSAPVADWSAHWFAGQAATIAEIMVLEEVWERAEQHVTLKMPIDGRRYLLNALLDVDLVKEKGGDGDERLLKAFAAEVVEDLGDRLDAVLEHDADTAGRRIIAPIWIGGEAVLTISITEAALVPSIKSQISVHKTGVRMQSRADALRRTHVTAQAMLGHGELSLNELKDLKVGDVVVLDRALTEPIDLYLAGRTWKRGTLRRNGSEISIQL